eukprot:CAMPEP_0181319690 /NCGR_PEP_ID=MMETSP1101-20121128/17714_1 /TAXON_ID=46948 /ORGANISM="Rhodomonas abbreviata, Strain Caron Lab Isolate" /LENGTH=383 /DNA_ID=CAMNT_0023427323 /DNA_START=23 /DNA_END=1171 /DNA_ORIENTATION=-
MPYVQSNVTRIEEPMPMYPPREGVEPAKPKPGGDILPLPYVGLKQEWNSPVDFGPYPSWNTERSWPGGHPVPPNGKEMTIYYASPIGEKIPLKVQGGDTVASVRQRIFKKIYGELQLLRHDDDVDERFAAAFIAPPSKPTLLKDVKDVALDTTVPGDEHYSRPEPQEPESKPTTRVIRKQAPLGPNYIPPQRMPQSWTELELYIGAAKLEDSEEQFSRAINTGAPPWKKTSTLAAYGIAEGSVLQPVYKNFAFEIKTARPKQDTKALGPLPTVDTLGSRVWDLLDPDAYVGTLEQAPRLFAEFFMPPSADEGTCHSNCQRDGMPHVGRLVPMVEKREVPQPRFYGSGTTQRMVDVEPWQQEQQGPGTRQYMVDVPVEGRDMGG